MNGTAAGVLGVACLLLAGLAIEACARGRQRTATAAQTLGAAMRTTPGRAAVLVVWLWLGVHFLAR